MPVNNSGDLFSFRPFFVLYSYRTGKRLVLILIDGEVSAFVRIYCSTARSGMFRTLSLPIRKIVMVMVMVVIFFLLRQIVVVVFKGCIYEGSTACAIADLYGTDLV